MKLEDIKSAARKKFEPFSLELADGSKVILSALIKLEEGARNRVKAAIEDINNVEGEGTDALELIVECISKIFTEVADKPTKLLAELHDEDLQVKVHMLTEVLTSWAKETKLGEVSNSPS